MYIEVELWPLKDPCWEALERSQEGLGREGTIVSAEERGLLVVLGGVGNHRGDLQEHKDNFHGTCHTIY